MDENVAADNGVAFSEMRLISTENMSDSKGMEAREQLPRTFWDVRLKGRMGSRLHGPRTFGRRWLTARPCGGE